MVTGLHAGFVRRARVIAVSLAALSVAAPREPLAGQSAQLVAVGNQDLRFGLVLPGLASSITRFDAVNAGKFEMRGQRRAEVQVEFTLPLALVNGTGATLTLQFAADDGGFSATPAIGSSQAFDPHQPLITSLGASGRLYVFLGGTVRPTSLQQFGVYQATITMTVAYTGV